MTQLRELVISILKEVPKGMRPIEMAPLIKRDDRFSTLNANNLGIHVLGPMIGDGLLSKDTKNKYKLVFQFEEI